MRVSIRGKTVAILASGPSLTVEDIDLLRSARVPFVAVNSTCFTAPDCIAMVAGDYRWWKAYGGGAPKCTRISMSKKAEKEYGAKRTKSIVKHGYNSGQVALEWVIRKKAGKIILLGYDCSLKHGIHHHGKHTKTPDPNQARLKHWQAHFRQTAERYKADVVNCSRYTELDCFPQRRLEDVLCELG